MGRCAAGKTKWRLYHNLVSRIMIPRSPRAPANLGPSSPSVSPAWEGSGELDFPSSRVTRPGGEQRAKIYEKAFQSNVSCLE